MSIVVRGYGLDLDSTSSIVAFGFTNRDATPVTPEQSIGDFTIDQSYVVDYSGQQRRPTRAEWIRWKKWVHYIQHGGLSIRVKKRGGDTIWLVERNTESVAHKQRQRIADRMTKGVKRA